jgi:hypothetical protein
LEPLPTFNDERGLEWFNSSNRLFSIRSFKERNDLSKDKVEYKLPDKINSLIKIVDRNNKLNDLLDE